MEEVVSLNKYLLDKLVGGIVGKLDSCGGAGTNITLLTYLVTDSRNTVMDSIGSTEARMSTMDLNDQNREMVIVILEP